VIAEPLVRERAVAARPDNRLHAQWFTSVLALLLPIFAVLYVLAIPSGNWPAVLAAQLVLTALLGVGGASASLVRMTVGATGITSRNCLGRVRVVPFEQVGSIIRLDLYRGTLHPQPQLFILSHDGELLLRMHGHCWPVETMEDMIRSIGAPVVRAAEPMTLLDLDRTHPELLSWIERRFTAPDSTD
jgi:hypothetical protein